MRIIKHPRVVQFYECLASKTKIYLVLELVTGGELFDLLVKERGFGETKARVFFKQLVEGVACCHAQGICHRDLKVGISKVCFCAYDMSHQYHTYIFFISA